MWFWGHAWAEYPVAVRRSHVWWFVPHHRHVAWRVAAFFHGRVCPSEANAMDVAGLRDFFPRQLSCGRVPGGFHPALCEPRGSAGLSTLAHSTAIRKWNCALGWGRYGKNSYVCYSQAAGAFDLAWTRAGGNGIRSGAIHRAAGSHCRRRPAGSRDDRCDNFGLGVTGARVQMRQRNSCRVPRRSASRRRS